MSSVTRITLPESYRDALKYSGDFTEVPEILEYMVEGTWLLPLSQLIYRYESSKLYNDTPVKHAVRIPKETLWKLKKRAEGLTISMTQLTNILLTIYLGGDEEWQEH